MREEYHDKTFHAHQGERSGMLRFHPVVFSDLQTTSAIGSFIREKRFEKFYGAIAVRPIPHA
jgi:hypothetical protein